MIIAQKVVNRSYNFYGVSSPVHHWSLEPSAATPWTKVLRRGQNNDFLTLVA